MVALPPAQAGRSPLSPPLLLRIRVEQVR
jgi:hypothetical protein